MKRAYLALTAAAVFSTTVWVSTPGCGDDDGTTVTCTQTLCQRGSGVCCAGGAAGTWVTAGSAHCVCGAADADADADDGGADADGDDGRADDTGPDADADDGPREDSGGCRSDLGGPCNVVLQCGCAAGERCIITGDAAPFEEGCDTAGTDEIDTPCTGADQCARQLQCFGTSAEDQACKRFCYENSDCPSGRPCSIGIRDITNPDNTGIKLCGAIPVDCDPFAAAGTAPCGSGEACVVVPSGGGNTCETEGTTAYGASCTSTGSCVAGAGCYTVDGGVTNLCYKYCDLDDDNPGCADSGIPGAACASGLGSDPIGVCIGS